MFAISKRSSTCYITHIERTRLTLIGNTIIKLLGPNFHLVVKKEYNVVPLSASTTMIPSCSPRSKYAWRRLASYHSGERSSVNPVVWSNGNKSYFDWSPVASQFLAKLFKNSSSWYFVPWIYLKVRRDKGYHWSNRVLLPANLRNYSLSCKINEIIL